MLESAVSIKAEKSDGVDVVRQSVRRLYLTNFRNYKQFCFEVDASSVVLTGANGVGKTNILEAVSFLTSGRGLRKATLDSIDHITDAGVAVGPWAVAAQVMTCDGVVDIGTGREVTTDTGRSKRIVKVDGEMMRGRDVLASLCTVIWLTPQMDGVFLEGASSRRKFLDRLVFHFDPRHATRVNAYEQAMRERARLLQQYNADPFWIAGLEQKMVESALAIAAARLETVALIQRTILSSDTPFPKAQIHVLGEVEKQILAGVPAVQIEVELTAQYKQARLEDARLGRTAIGVHRSDLHVFHLEKHMIAERCSTGEQKALLLSIVLAEARARARWRGSVPILLLDEVVAHLDEDRRCSLFEELESMGAQSWLTGTDKGLFAALEGKAQFLDVGCMG